MKLSAAAIVHTDNMAARSTQRWVGARPWLRYPLKSEDFVHRSQGAVAWSTKRGAGYGVFPYQVEE